MENNALGWGAAVVCIITIISSHICEGFIYSYPACYATRQSTQLTISHRWYPPIIIDGRYPTKHMMVSSGFSFSDGEQILVSLQSEYMRE